MIVVVSGELPLSVAVITSSTSAASLGVQLMVAIAGEPFSTPTVKSSVSPGTTSVTLWSPSGPKKVMRKFSIDSSQLSAIALFVGIPCAIGGVFTVNSISTEKQVVVPSRISIPVPSPVPDPAAKRGKGGKKRRLRRLRFI